MICVKQDEIKPVYKIPGDSREALWKRRYKFIKGSLGKMVDIARDCKIRENMSVYISILKLMDEVEEVLREHS